MKVLSSAFRKNCAGYTTPNLMWMDNWTCRTVTNPNANENMYHRRTDEPTYREPRSPRNKPEMNYYLRRSIAFLQRKVYSYMYTYFIILGTLFFFYKNLVYKNIKASNSSKIKNMQLFYQLLSLSLFEASAKKRCYYKKDQ